MSGPSVRDIVGYDRGRSEACFFNHSEARFFVVAQKVILELCTNFT